MPQQRFLGRRQLLLDVGVAGKAAVLVLPHIDRSLAARASRDGDGGGAFFQEAGEVPGVERCARALEQLLVELDRAVEPQRGEVPLPARRLEQCKFGGDVRLRVEVAMRKQRRSFLQQAFGLREMAESPMST